MQMRLRPGRAARRYSRPDRRRLRRDESSPPSLAPVAITDIGSVAGKWAGPVTGLATRRDQGDWVNVVIAPDGTYDFGIYRTIGMFGGKGKVTVQDGKLVLHGDRGTATLTLFEGGGKRVLRGDGVLSDEPGSTAS